jgi:hypothetical protein
MVGEVLDFPAFALAMSRRHVHFRGVNRSACLFGSLALLAVALPARAEVPRRIANASLVVQRVATELTSRAEPVTAAHTETELMLRLPPSLSAETLIAAADSTQAIEAATPKDAKQKSAASTPSYRSLLGYLVITRDLQIPGAPLMAVRLIPTTKALAGDTSPIVLRPRLDGAGSSWTGLDIAALF